MSSNWLAETLEEAAARVEAWSPAKRNEWRKMGHNIPFTIADVWHQLDIVQRQIETDFWLGVYVEYITIYTDTRISDDVKEMQIQDLLKKTIIKANDALQKLENPL